jgi:hypothetical protein
VAIEQILLDDDDDDCITRRKEIEKSFDISVNQSRVLTGLN